jgi:hypothetical protein
MFLTGDAGTGKSFTLRHIINEFEDRGLNVAISIVGSKLFNVIDDVTKFCKKNNEPFGGIQIITCGDFG